MAAGLVLMVRLISLGNLLWLGLNGLQDTIDMGGTRFGSRLDLELIRFGAAGLLGIVASMLAGMSRVVIF